MPNDKIIEQFLRKENYFFAYVTVETFDWKFNDLLKKNRKNIDLEKLKKLYISAILDSIVFYSNLAKDLFGSDIKHILLLHENDLNALFLQDLIRELKKNAIEIIDISKAYSSNISELYFIENSQRFLRAYANKTKYQYKKISNYEDIKTIQKAFKECLY